MIGALMAAGTALKIGANLYSGISALQSANSTASLLEEQGYLTRDDYFRQAGLVREEGQRFRAKQTMDYISAGVEIAGTPQLVLKETLSKAGAKASSLETTGMNYQALYNRKAKIVRSEGRASMIQGVMGAGGSLLEGLNG